MRILKTKWYLLRLTDNTLLTSSGVFDTEQQARKAARSAVTTIRGAELQRRMAREKIKIEAAP